MFCWRSIEVYKMTGGVGSWLYMAPEVVRPLAPQDECIWCFLPQGLKGLVWLKELHKFTQYWTCHHDRDECHEDGHDNIMTLCCDCSLSSRRLDTTLSMFCRLFLGVFGKASDLQWCLDYAARAGHPLIFNTKSIVILSWWIHSHVGLPEGI